MNQYVSVIIPTYKRADMLLRCLAALSVQNYDSNAYEVLVVDDERGGITEKYVRFFQTKKNPVIRYLRTNGSVGPSSARNMGVKIAKGKIIAFTDDDCIPDPYWLAEGVKYFKKGIVGVSGRIIVPKAIRRPTDYTNTVSRLENAEFVTANCFYLKEIFLEMGGFDENFRIPWREDADLYFRMIERRFKLDFNPDAIVIHPVREAKWGISLGEQRKSMYNALLFKKHPKLYKDKIQKNPPWNYYIIFLALVSAFVFNVFKKPLFALVAAVIWGSYTAELFFKRIFNTSRRPGHIIEMVITSIFIPFLSIFWRLYGAIKFATPFL